MSLTVVEDACTKDAQGNTANMVLESDAPTPQEAIAELSHMDARSMAMAKAAQLFAITSPGVSGMSNHPYPVNSEGVSFDDFKETEENKFQLHRYRVTIPVSRGYR